MPWLPRRKGLTYRGKLLRVVMSRDTIRVTQGGQSWDLTGGNGRKGGEGGTGTGTFSPLGRSIWFGIELVWLSFFGSSGGIVVKGSAVFRESLGYIAIGKLVRRRIAIFRCSNLGERVGVI